ncbi:MAG: serine/threonine-protein kinase [Phycisphaerae bacterium]|nr:MAG: serine/threonine protein kinase [Planctomycetota bacterium]KAB2939915.1 MAG: serine/threonine protein kinase [Phycisphaerae bacterium]MBE7455125.1 serine/threonine protein kinase [Planctomycetia bacterium]MCK6466438.1 serine/threonine-protein kinase [Phycisphaerae bacterium]MCL4720231.1 serine/threonine-protein kinase [Phycisphaerae bacterium]
MKNTTASPDRNRGDRMIAEARQQAAELSPHEAPSSCTGENAFLNIAAPDFFGPHDLPGYQIIREIHRGGQGVVYHGVQLATKRDVAIKVLHGTAPGAAASDRLRREIDILRNLNHPGLVPILDAAVVGGRLCLVMPYISGRPVDEYARDAALPMPELLSLFTRICDAVQAVHLRGVMHRDLKPGNILVDDDGVPHVLDFGLARHTSSEDAPPGLTRTGQFVGSLPYSSPEQAEGRRDLDLRTDVYSLGVVLYQLLTDVLPHDTSGSMREVLDRLSGGTPVAPRTLRKDLDDDVSVIVLKCLACEPQRRYQSAGELADDLRRFLFGRPIQARPDSFGYVARKFIRRHRAAVVLTTVVLLGGLAGGVGLVQLQSSRRQTREALRMISDNLEVFSWVWSYQDSASAVGRLEVLSRELDALEIDDARQAFDLHTRLRAACLRFARYDLASRHGRLAYEAAVRAAGPVSIEAAKALGSCAIDHPEEAVDFARRMMETAQALGDPEMIADSHGTLGGVYRHRREYEQAKAHFLAGIEVLRSASGVPPINLAHHLKNAAEFFSDDLGKYEDADRMQREALDLAIRVCGSDDEWVAHYLHSYAVLLRKMDRLEEAETLARQALDIREKEYPPNAYYAYYRYVSQTNLGAILTRQGRFDEAQPLLLDAYALFQGPDDINLRICHAEIAGFIADLYERWDEQSPGRGYAEQAAEWRERQKNQAALPVVETPPPEDDSGF